MREISKIKIVRLLAAMLLLVCLLGGVKNEQTFADTVNCKVTFSGFDKLNASVPQGSLMVLPTLASSTGYTGWENPSYGFFSFGQTVRVNGNVIFYASQRKDVKCEVHFFNNSGGTNASYEKMGQTVSRGNEITLPKFGTVAGYQNIGWTTAKGKTTPIYKVGSRFVVGQDTNFYAVRARILKLNFADTNGTAGADFTKLAASGISGTKITLPAGPSKLEGDFVGWSTVKNATTATYKAGTTVTLKKDTTLYAVYTPMVEIRFYSQNRIGVRKLRVAPGTTVRLVGYHEEGYTMLGWGTTSGLSTRTGNKVYDVGQAIVLNKSMKLFAIMMDKRLEKNISANTMPRLDTTKYTKVIFVGDSRTVLMQNHLNVCLQNGEFSSAVLKGYTTVAKRGSGLTWLKNTGYQDLLKAIGNGGTASKPIAIVFNHGINDITSISSYITYMKQIAPALQKKNCVLYYMSLNPVNNVVLNKRGLDVKEQHVYAFNNKIKSQLCGTGSAYRYIDTYTELYKNGFAHYNEYQTKDDGLHFSYKTYKRIYAYTIKQLNADAANR
ncbi:MAG: InlB B-repeat-containing protein [Clostridiales bacterium]|nr:InlB B-repeat-containing protein [Candidatus Blautia equi]